MSDDVILAWNRTDYSDIHIVTKEEFAEDICKIAVFDAEGDAEDYASGRFLNYKVVSLSGEEAI